MGTLSNDPLVLSMYGAFYKVFGATGNAIVSALDADKKSFVSMFASYWGLTSGSLLILLPLVLKRVTNTSMSEEIQQAKFVGAGGPQSGIGLGTDAEIVGLELEEEKGQKSEDKVE